LVNEFVLGDIALFLFGGENDGGSFDCAVSRQFRSAIDKQSEFAIRRFRGASSIFRAGFHSGILGWR
jgi:hypothetical protein